MYPFCVESEDLPYPLLPGQRAELVFTDEFQPQAVDNGNERQYIGGALTLRHLPMREIPRINEKER